MKRKSYHQVHKNKPPIKLNRTLKRYKSTLGSRIILVGVTGVLQIAKIKNSPIARYSMVSEKADEQLSKLCKVLNQAAVVVETASSIIGEIKKEKLIRFKQTKRYTKK